MANRRVFIQQVVSVALLDSFRPFSTAGAKAAEYLTGLRPREPGFSATKPEWKLYEVAGQFLFPIYASNGSLSTKQVCYLIRPKLLKSGTTLWQANVDGGNLGRGTASKWGWEALAIGFNDLEFYATGDSEEAVKQLVKAKLERATAMGKPVQINLDGGSFPLPEEETWTVAQDGTPAQLPVNMEWLRKKVGK